MQGGVSPSVCNLRIGQDVLSEDQLNLHRVLHAEIGPVFANYEMHKKKFFQIFTKI
jgi:hypothetical protein